MTRLCKVDGCEREFTAKDYCNMHYQRWLKSGDPGEIEPRRIYRGDCECSIAGCESKQVARGWCSKHWKRWSVHGDPSMIITERETQWTEEEYKILELYYPAYGRDMSVLLPKRTRHSAGSMANRLGFVKTRQRKPYEPHHMHYQEGSGSLYVWWPEHIVANKRGRVIVRKLVEWQNAGMPIDLENWAYSGRGGKEIFYKKYEPRHFNAREDRENSDSFHWPEHIITDGSGRVSMGKLTAWQEVGMPLDLENWCYVVTSRGTGDSYFRKKYGPRDDGLDLHNGYLSMVYPLHPLATNGRVYLHRWVIWQENGYSDKVLELLLNGAHVHHLNGKRDDNSPENLELRIDGRHPDGVGESDMVKTLAALGYKIQPPIWKRAA